MSIKGNNPANQLLVANTDTTLLNPTTGRAAITFASLHEQTGAVETVELFISADATSAAGERLDTLTFAADETMQPASLAGLTINNGSFLIANATNGNRVEVNLSYTQYTGDS